MSEQVSVLGNKTPIEWQHLDCPVCASQAFTHLFYKEGEPFVCCDGCRLVMINPRPSYEQVLNTYGEDYGKGYARKLDSKRRRAKKTVALLDLLLKRLKMQVLRHMAWM